MKKVLLYLTLTAMFTSCGTYKTLRWVDIGANETAFVIPVEQGTESSQKVLKSIEYLEQKKVTVKRVYLNQKKISTWYFPWNFKYISTDTVIIVHRAPVTREWTEDTKTGTSASNQSLNVESSESIGFDIPVNCTASVLEEDASKFLYHFGGRSIEQVMDQNVRPYILDILTTEFGRLKLDECQTKRNDIYVKMKEKTISFFKDYGLTVINLGVAGQFTYTDKEIQNAINTKYISEMKVTAAQNEVDAANKFASAAEAIKKQKELDADVKIKDALAEAIRTGKLTWPQTLVMGKDGNLMDIWAAKNLNSGGK